MMLEEIKDLRMRAYGLESSILSRNVVENYKTIQGDLFESPWINYPVVIPHCCNNIGLFGAGFASALTHHHPYSRTKYLEWYDKKYDFQQRVPFELGQIQTVEVHPQIWVINMIAQNGVRSKRNLHPLSYYYLERCMEQVSIFVSYLATPPKPVRLATCKFGSGLAGGDYKIIEPMVKKHWATLSNVSVEIFSL